MARMIPSFMDENIPPGERDVFNMLAAGPDDWMALHSLDLAPWNHGLRTEIDFVVIVPDTGIICIEVKSHDNLSYDGYSWHPETIKRSPFKQASNGRHAFYRRLAELAPQFRHVPVVHCCIFPRARFDLSENLSVQSWELMDIRAFRSFKNGDEFCADLKDKMRRNIETDRNLTNLRDCLSQGQIDKILGYCLPVQKCIPNAREEIQRRETKIEEILLEQQKSVLNLAALNDRLVVYGGAGTGKTLIAMEVALRAAERGQRVALLCFNHLVGDWMKQKIGQTRPVLPNLIVGRVNQVMAEMMEIEIPNNPSRKFWETELPLKLEERLTDPELKADASFDYIVVDEAQDILARPWLWQCLTQFFSNSLENGSFALFGDFAHQVLSEREPMLKALGELNVSTRPVKWKLCENCRNYRIVGETAVKLSALSNVYTGYRRIGGSIKNYDIFFYEDEKAQLEKIAQCLKEFKGLGYKPSEITLLSFRADEMCAAVKLEKVGYKLRPAWQSSELTAYASVHAFKGMENKVVILTDVILGNQDFQRDLFYTGMTRATESVRVFCEMGSTDTLCRWLSEGGCL